MRTRFPSKAGASELFENNRGRNVDAAIVISRANDALLCHHADDGKARGADAHLLPNRVDGVEQVFGDAGAENGDTLRGIIFGRGEKAPLCNFVVAHLQEVGGHANDRDSGHRCRTALHILRRALFEGYTTDITQIL